MLSRLTLALEIQMVQLWIFHYPAVLKIERQLSLLNMLPDKQNKILIEVMYKADYCLPCFYMDETVREVIPKYDKYVEYRRVEFMKGEGKSRFLELSCSLFGEEGVYRYCRIAPVPSLFINGELFFDAIPPKFELEDAIEEVLMANGYLKKN